jgi:hypothetical protein
MNQNIVDHVINETNSAISCLILFLGHKLDLYAVLPTKLIIVRRSKLLALQFLSQETTCVTIVELNHLPAGFKSYWPIICKNYLTLRLLTLRPPFEMRRMITGAGDSHFGYFGFRTNNTNLVDNGAMDVVVDNWNNKTAKQTNPPTE